MRSAVARDPTWLEAAAARGDDYEILAAVPGERVAAFLKDAGSLGFAVTRIGEVHAGNGVRMLQPDGAEVIFERAGWDHFLE